MDKSGVSSAISGAVQEEIADVVAFIREEAEHARTAAATYRHNHNAPEEARMWSKIAEKLGYVANRIERGEYR